MVLLAVVSWPAAATLCRSMDIRNSPRQLETLRNCSVIDGFLQVVLIENVNFTTANGSFSLRPVRESDYEGLVFPKLREVTGCVIFHRVSKLRSLGQLFPNLSVIRGDFLFKNFALFVFKMPDLQEIGLSSLTIIGRGSVAIVNNPKLCFARTVDWNRIIVGEHYLNLRNISCPQCPKDCYNNNCWNQTTCQLPTSKIQKCHYECIGGCWGPGPDQCNACKHFRVDDTCSPTCPSGRYKYQDRFCVTKEQCVAMETNLSKWPKHWLVGGGRPWFTWNGQCIFECPPETEQLPNGCLPCSRECPRVCPSARIDSAQAAQRLRSCNFIDGNLHIEIISGSRSFIAEELHLALRNVSVINGILTITNSYPIENLFFFENLVSINGNQSNNTFSLIIKDNPNLQELFNWDRPMGRNISIENGRILIHFNPKLCPQYINDLTEVSKISNITNFVVSKNANGVNYLCNVLNVTIDVEFKTALSVCLVIHRPTFSNRTAHDWLRLMVYYKEAPQKNVTSQFNSDACNNDGWKINDVDNLAVGSEKMTHLIAHLKPDTQYAYFIKIYSPNNSGGHSKIYYIRTLPSRPSIPLDIKAYSNSSEEIIVRWKPPAQPNGKLKSYIIRGYLLNYEEDINLRPNMCLHPLPNADDSEVQPSFVQLLEEEREVVSRKPSYDSLHLCGQNAILKPSKYLSTFAYNGSILTCEDAVFNIIETELFKLPNPYNTPQYNNYYPMLSEEDTSVDESLESFNDDGSFSHFIKRFNQSTHFAKLIGLKHFSTYVIEVLACRMSVMEDPDFDDDKFIPQTDSISTQCSQSVMFTLRTQKSKVADIINEKHVHVKVLNKSVEIVWKKPERFNGAVVSYNLQLKRSDHENAKAEEKCVSDGLGGEEEKYSRRSLDFGHYIVRVRANSLAGEGPWSPWVQFYIVDESHNFYKAIMTIVLAVTLVLLSCALVGAKTLSYFFKKRNKGMDKMIKTVNPEYSSLATGYVEDEWELSRDDVQLIKEIKQGNFGMVYEGLLIPENRPVAVKTMIESASIRDQIEFLKEATIMKSFSKAHHVVKLIGIVSRGQPILVVMELMALGDLKTFLRQTRTWPPAPSASHLHLMAAQIADGMVYLEAYKFVHRDLAARNCMVSQDMTVKIGDFGMTRDVYETDYYRKGDKGLLPIRWMAPESLNDGVFTTASDVWSYGVVLWEMVTLAAQPYQGLSNQQVLSYVVSGNKLEPPVYSPPLLREMMVSCWKWKPKLRPSFVDILSQLEAHLPDEFRGVSFFHSDEGEAARAEQVPEPNQMLVEDLSENSLLLVPASSTVEFTSRSSNHYK